MPRGGSVCMLAVCVVLMNGASFSYAQQTIGLRPSLGENRSDPFRGVDLDAPQDETLRDDTASSDNRPTSRDADDVDAEEDEQAFGDATLLPPPPPGGIAPVDTERATVAQPPEATAPVVGPYEPLGLRTGAFIAYPSVEVTGIYSSNVRESSSNEQEDVGLRVAPALRVESDWVRHRFSLDASGELIFYDTATDFDERNADVTSRLQLDMRRSTTLDFISDYELSQTGPSSGEVPDTASGKRTEHEFGFTARATHEANRLITRGSIGARYFLFEDVDLAGGGSEDNSDRNYVEPFAELRLSYEHSPAVRPFAELRYEPRIHDERVDRSGLRRDSHGGTVAAGVEFNLSPIWEGSVAVIYETRVFDDSSLDTVHSGGVEADVTWRPTPLTTVRWTAESDLEESASAGVTAIRDYETNVVVTHALQDNASISANAGVSFEDRIGSKRDELTYTGGLAISYLISRELEVIMRSDFTAQNTKNSDDDYFEARATAGFRYRL